MSESALQIRRETERDEKDLNQQQFRQQFKRLVGVKQGHNYWKYEDPDSHCPIPKQAPLPYLQESKLFLLAQQGDQDARNTLWLLHARLAFSVINLFRIPASMLADVLQEGILKLPKAIAKFELHQYNAFSTYAWYWVRQGMQRFIRAQRFNMRIPEYLYVPYFKFRHMHESSPLAAEQTEQMNRMREWDYETYLQFLDYKAVHDAESYQQEDEGETACAFDEAPEEHLHALELKEFVNRLLECLDGRSEEIIRFRYGLTDLPAQTLEEVGQRLRITRERVRQIEEKAIKRLRRQARRLVKQYRNTFLCDCIDNALPSDDVMEIENDLQPDQVTQSPG